jgi:LysM repeat protein
MPKTGFDVDLYYPRSNDTYESISQEYYNDKRYAAALRAFNSNAALQGGQTIDVPPMHVLKKSFATFIGTQPGGAPRVVPTGASSTPEWGSAPKPDPAPARPANNRNTFVVPPSGMTMEAIARQVGVTWRDIYDLNPSYNPGVFLPAGTELRMPANAKLP